MDARDRSNSHASSAIALASARSVSGRSRWLFGSFNEHLDQPTFRFHGRCNSHDELLDGGLVIEHRVCRLENRFDDDDGIGQLMGRMRPITSGIAQASLKSTETNAPAVAASVDAAAKTNERPNRIRLTSDVESPKAKQKQMKKVAPIFVSKVKNQSLVT